MPLMGSFVLRRWTVLAFLSVAVPASLARRPSRVVSQNSPAVRRILSEWKNVQSDGLAMGDGEFSVRGNSTETFRLKPAGNLFEWHFTFLGAKGSPFEGGLYHGSISLPANYPVSGPSVRLLNKNQRFKVGSRICLSASEFHQDTWQPSWTVSSLVSALVAHMTEPAAEIGSVQGATPSQKRTAAIRSRDFSCVACGCRHDAFPEDRFPRPRGSKRKKRHKSVVCSTSDVQRSDTRQERMPRPVATTAAATQTALSGRSRLSWTVRFLASKVVLFALALLAASLLLSQPHL